jgi:hypothetical protein
VAKIETKRIGPMFGQRRAELGFKLVDLEQLSRGELAQMSLSRFESGRLVAPGYELVTRYGLLLGWSPNEIAAKFGLWNETQTGDGELGFIAEQMRRLPEGRREEFRKIVANLAKVFSESDKT